MKYTEFLSKVAAGNVPGATEKVKRVEVGSKRLVAFVESPGKEGGPPAEKRYEVILVATMDPKDLVNSLREQNVEVSFVEEDDFLAQLLLWTFPLVIVVVFWMWLMRRMGPPQSVMSFGKSKAKIYAEKEIKVTFADVAGIDEAVEEVKEVVEFLRDPKKFQALGARIPKGVLLLGAPGTGKTLLARAVAGEAKVPFFSLSGSDFVEMFVGVGASRVRDLFRQAEQQAPCIVFIDELDALGKVRGSSPVSNDEREQTLNALLVEMDGFESNSGVIIMAATNRPEILDPALLRPGRFDRQIVVDKPDIAGREHILRVHARKVKMGAGVDLKVIASRMPGFAGADLANVVNEAALLAARRGKKEVEATDFEEAIDRVVAGLERKARLMSPREKEIVAYHECGHALVAVLSSGADPVHRVSIIPRGFGSLGHTLQLPTEERYLVSHSDLLARIAVSLGGRAAEALVYGEVSTGAHNDLEVATRIARKMVKEFGMSDRMGPVALDESQKTMLGEGWGAKREYSEQTAREVDLEVKRILDEAAVKADALLRANRAALDALQRRLVEKEILDRQEVYALARSLATSPVNEPPPSSHAGHGLREAAHP
ncbi:MAG: ATP-dependent zinc metalloprotease FtsH [Planctomycetaceae bacterium]|nr:ATP-dependent zinc metalloprotease FtsH [Planctomycetaceae bacterium]